MVKSIHDLSESEKDDLSNEIKELLKEFKQKKDEEKVKNNNLNSESLELSSWFTSIEEFKETDENLAQEHEGLSQKDSNEVKKEIPNLVDEKKSSAIESSEHSYNIEDLIENDETLKELRKLTTVLQNDFNESASKENEFSGSTVSWTTQSFEKKNSISKGSSTASTSVRQSNTSNADTYKTVETNLSSATAKEHKKKSNIQQVDLKLDSTSKQNNFQRPHSKQNSFDVLKKDGVEIKNGKWSNSSLKGKKKAMISKETPKMSIVELTFKKKPYTEGSPEYIKGHYVPIVPKKKKLPDIVTRRRVSSVSVPSKRTGSTISKPGEIPAPLFPLKIDCISLFSDEEVAEEGVEEEESDSESGSGPGEPDVMLNQLWQDSLLPSDESDMDLNEFYKQFPKLKKKAGHRDSLEENYELFPPFF